MHGADLSYDGRKIVALKITDRPAPVHIVILRLRRQMVRPAVQTFADFMRAAFQPGGLFAANVSYAAA